MTILISQLEAALAEAQGAETAQKETYAKACADRTLPIEKVAAQDPGLTTVVRGAIESALHHAKLHLARTAAAAPAEQPKS